ncbi:TonB-dependent receptor domain-containing protein [Pseudomonadota bacterium]|nr:TonB-dependent receptor [Xanthomonadales bacterium]
MPNVISSTPLNRLLLLLAASLFLAAHAQAQDSDTEEEANETLLEEVIVTGTHIAGLDETVLPVTVMGAEQIEALGAVNMGEILSYIPSISDLEFEDNSNGTNAARGDVASVSMRGLDSANTLTLINGRRMVTWPTFQAQNSVPSTFYNVNTIPSSAIQRIEVLRDGAAPLYGADAIAGVVNFVTYDSYDGIRFAGKYGFSDDTNFDETEITAAGGWEFNEGRSNFSLFATWYDRSKVHMNELDDLYYDLDRRQNERIPESWQGDSQLRNTSTLTPYARFRVGSLRDDGIFVGPTYHVDGDTGEIQTGSGSERYNFNEDAWVTPETERFNVMATYQQELGATLDLFADAYYYKSDSRIIRAASPLDDSLAFLIVPADAYHNPFDEDVLLLGWRPIDLGPRIVDTEHEAWGLTAGLRGDWAGWDWEAAVLYSDAENKDTEGNRQAKSLFTQQLMVDGPDALNPFVGPGGNSQAALDGIRIAATDVRSASITMADLRVNRGDLFSVLGNDVGAAFGLEWRQEDYYDDRDPRLDGSMPFDSGAIFDESDVIGTSATFDSGASRDTYSAYGEFNIPLIGAANENMMARSFEIQLAARYESPSDFDDTLKPKIGLRWEPTEGLLFRASYTEGFKAPNLPQMNQGDIVRRIDGIQDPMRGDVTGRPIDTGDTYRRTTRLGNPDLEPQDSETWLVGFTFSPTWAGDWTSGLRISADWWRINLEGVVGLIDEEQQLALDQQLRETGAGFNPNVVRAEITPGDQAAFDAWNAANPGDQRIPVGEAIDIIGQYQNLDTREVEGWDGSLVYAMPETRAGQFTFRTDVTKITRFVQEGLANPDLLRRNGNPETRYTVALDWNFRGFRANGTMRYVSEVYDTSLTQSASIVGPGIVIGNTKYWQVDDWTVYNVSLSYDFAELSESTRGLLVSAGIRNLTNEEPPFADESFGYFTRLHNTYGRVYWAQVGYRF